MASLNEASGEMDCCWGYTTEACNYNIIVENCEYAWTAVAIEDSGGPKEC